MKMHSSTSLIRLKRLIVLGSVVAYAAASAVGASASRTVAAPDVFERYAATHDSNSASAPDVVERYVTTHSLGLATGAPAVGTERIVDDSFRDAARYVPAAAAGNGGLDWADFGIGAGAMLGLTLLVVGLGLGAVVMRHRAGKLETS
jgi:hypothetical protein